MRTVSDTSPISYLLLIGESELPKKAQAPYIASDGVGEPLVLALHPLLTGDLTLAG